MCQHYLQAADLPSMRLHVSLMCAAVSTEQQLPSLPDAVHYLACDV